ncbi:hypothetical protein Acy02nite_15720 [Actinoplanes cyaneus]|uniref:Uncharacterized protein n=1 Tax=Actinoplanes cyaneus TaxID=52696 RepID=A0A919IEE0_9ACTN|nr:hypothetical protein Acy02nite_15720 [Actinoplanes cyaneus]
MLGQHVRAPPDEEHEGQVEEELQPGRRAVGVTIDVRWPYQLAFFLVFLVQPLPIRHALVDTRLTEIRINVFTMRKALAYIDGR